jgi:hypothetical protein
MILKVLPSAGYNDIENEVHVQGLNFNEGISLTMRLSDTVSGTGQISQTITLTTTRINGSLLRAIVPEGLEAGIYDMTATNPNNLEGTLAEAYSVLSPDGNNDLTAYDYELWVNPIVPREGETVDLGVFVYRYGGKDVLQDVEVRFMLTDPFTGTELGTSTIPFLDPPEGHDSTRPIQVTFPHTGTFDIYAIIDPNDLVAEDNELNNIVMRTITVLPAGDDNTVPVVQNILINGGKNETVQTPGVSVEVDVFDPAPSSGVVASHIVEYIYNIGASQWIPVAQSGWLTYTDTPSTYQWSLQNKAGIHYLHVRAIDGNGNVSIGNSMQRVNYEPSIERVERRETRIYRYDVGEGNSLEVALEVLKGDADLFVWSGRSEQSKWVSNLDEGNELVSIPVTEIAPGVYQIEVYGFTAADYRLNVAIKAGQNANSVAQVGGTSPDKAQPSKPVVEVNNVPDPRNGTIPAVSLPAADDEPVGPSTPAVYLPLITNG